MDLPKVHHDSQDLNSSQGVGGLGPLTTGNVGKGLVLFFITEPWPWGFLVGQTCLRRLGWGAACPGEGRTRSGDMGQILFWKFCSMAALLITGHGRGRNMGLEPWSSPSAWDPLLWLLLPFQKGLHGWPPHFLLRDKLFLWEHFFQRHPLAELQREESGWAGLV